MRHLTAVLEDCEHHGIRLAAKEDRLAVRGNLTPELREELSRCKPNVLSVLRTGRCIHELTPGVCKLCSGEVRRLIEGQKERAS